MEVTANAAKLWALIIPTIKCEFCGKTHSSPGSDDHDFATQLDEEGWTVSGPREKVKCPKCNKKK